MAIVAAIASGSVVQYATPVDHALPFLAIVVVVLGYSSGSRQQAAGSRQQTAGWIAVPLLLICEAVIPDERTRLMAIGIVMAAAFASSFRAHPVVITILAVL